MRVGCAIRSSKSFPRPQDIIGASLDLNHVVQQVEVVAATDPSVLILGETGTGKELVARAIHNLTSQRDRIFVVPNYSSIPSGLLESELFGLKMRAFTGASTREIGRFELASKGPSLLAK